MRVLVSSKVEVDVHIACIPAKVGNDIFIRDFGRTIVGKPLQRYGYNGKGFGHGAREGLSGGTLPLILNNLVIDLG